MGTKQALVIAGLVAAMLAGCGFSSNPSPQPTGDHALLLFVRNQTDREVTILVDGLAIRSVAARTRVRGEVVIVPARPSHTVLARSTTGHVFGSFSTAEVAVELGVPGFVENTRCGDLWVWLEHDVAREIAPLPREQQPACD